VYGLKHQKEKRSMDMELRALRSIYQLAACSCLPLPAPLRTLPIRTFELNHCKLCGGIDQDLLEYLYSGAALS